MLSFSESDMPSKKLAVYYAKKLNDDLMIEILSAKKAISSAAEAKQVTRAFWEMVDLAAQDNQHDVSIEGITDIEFWMHKLFNIIMGYVDACGFKSEWNSITREVNSGEGQA